MDEVITTLTSDILPWTLFQHRRPRIGNKSWKMRHARLQDYGVIFKGFTKYQERMLCICIYWYMTEEKLPEKILKNWIKKSEWRHFARYHLILKYASDSYICSIMMTRTMPMRNVPMRTYLDLYFLLVVEWLGGGPLTLNFTDSPNAMVIWT